MKTLKIWFSCVEEQFEFFKKKTSNYKLWTEAHYIVWFSFPIQVVNSFCLPHITISVIICCFTIMLCTPTYKLSSKSSKTAKWVTGVKCNLLIKTFISYILHMNVAFCSTEMSNPAGYHVELKRSQNEDDVNEHSIIITLNFSLPILYLRIHIFKK